MARLPTFLARTAGNLVAVPDVQVATGAISGGLSKAAGDVEALAGRIRQENERSGRIWATRRNAELRAGLIKAGTERELSGEPLDGFGSWYETSAKEAYATALADAPNDFAKQYLDEYGISAVAAFGETGLRKEADYRVTQNMVALDDTLESLKSAAFLDPGNAEAYADQWRFALDGAELPYDKAAALKDSDKAIFGSAIGALVESDPYAARGRVAGWVEAGYLSAEQGLTFQNRADAGIKSREAEARARAAESRAAAAEAAGVYLNGVDDYLAYRAAGNPPVAELEAKFSPSEIARLPVKNAADLAKKTADAMTRGDVFLSLREDPSQENMSALLAEVTAAAADPENYQFNAETARLVGSAIGDFQAALDKTPGDVAWASSRVQEAAKAGSGVNIVAASYAEQERLGVPSWKRAPLSEGYAKQVIEQIASLPPDEQASAVQELAKSYGSYWPDVLKQIGDKLPGTLSIAASMPPGRAATRVAEASGLKIDELTAGLGSDAREDIETAMAGNDRLASLGRVLTQQVGGGATLAKYNDAVMRSALVLMRDGKSPSEAVEIAAYDVTEDTTFIESGGSVIAAPAGENPDIIAAGLEAARVNLDVSAVDLPESYSGYTPDEIKAAYASSVRRNGEWVADGKGRGLYLRVMGDLVTRGGEPVLFTWDDLKSAALPKDSFMFEAGR